MQFDKESITNVMESIKGLGRGRLLALGIVGAGILGTIGGLVIYGNSPQQSLLYGGLQLNEASQMVDDLNKAHITNHTSADGQSIYVPRNRISEARLLLAKDGLPGGGAVGYELFDKNGTLTSTQFEQGIDQTRAMEGELERSIRLIHGVRNVRVHLVLPHRDLFSTETNPAQASVILDVGRSGAVASDAVSAMQNLVSAAVPGLQAHSVSIVDTRGEVLAQPTDPDSVAGQQSSLEKQRHAEEERLSQSVEDILSPAVGMGHVRARVAVTMNTDIINETQESYDPDEQVLRSQTTSNDRSSNSESDPNSSVGNNLPNSQAGSNKSGSNEDRNEETDNYEIGKRTRVVNQTKPRVSRLSIAVMVDGETSRDSHGKEAWKPLDDSQIKRLSSIVESTIGYDKERGDRVNVVSMPFKLDQGVDFPNEKEPIFTRDLVVYLIEWLVPLLLLIVAGLVIVRPLLKRVRDEKDEKGGSEAKTGGNVDITVHDENIKLDGIKGEIRKESVLSAVDVVEKNPDSAVSVLRNWLNDTYESMNNP